MRITKRWFLFFLLPALFFINGCYPDYEYDPNWELILKREPYLQSEGNQQLRVRWMCNKPMEDPQLIWDGMEYPAYTIDHRLGIMYEAVVPKPEEVRKVAYEIFEKGEPFSPVYKTNLLRLPQNVLQFFAVGDIGESTAKGGFPHLMNGILQDKDSLQFGILLGDIVYEEGESEKYDAQLFGPLALTLSKVPVYPVLGNHDWESNLNQNFFLEWHEIGNGHYYHFAYGNAHFIVLDSKEGNFYRYRRQKAWLEEVLKAAQGRYTWTIVALHHNGKSCTYKDDNDRVVSFYKLFADYGVDLVLNGHAHTYERLNPMNRYGTPRSSGDIHHYSGEMPGWFISITTGAGGRLAEWNREEEGCRYSDLVARAVHLGHVSTVRIEENELKFRVYTHDQELVDYFVWEK